MKVEPRHGTKKKLGSPLRSAPLLSSFGSVVVVVVVEERLSGFWMVESSLWVRMGSTSTWSWDMLAEC